MPDDGKRDGFSTVTIGVVALDDVQGRVRAAFSGEAQGAFISFASPELMWKVLTARRWGIIRVMTSTGELSIREVARRVGRDVKAVHGDVTALILAGVLERSKAGVIFPYDSVRVDFTLTKAA
jgi:predicted transcriptional regulator